MHIEKINESEKVFCIDKHGYLYFKIANKKDCKNFKSEQLYKFINLATTTAREKPKPLLIDLRNVHGVLSSSTFCILAKDIKFNESFTKIAFIAGSLSIKIMILNYIRIYKPLASSRVFNTIEKGIDYLLYKPKNIVWK